VREVLGKVREAVEAGGLRPAGETKTVGFGEAREVFRTGAVAEEEVVVRVKET
jgi:hypothetical protein